jgi:hypothetical protein
VSDNPRALRVLRVKRLVEGKVILELKSVERLGKVQHKQFAIR